MNLAKVCKLLDIKLIPVINGQMIYEDAVNDLKQHSRQYAKRQMTWFRIK